MRRMMEQQMRNNMPMMFPTSGRRGYTPIAAEPQQTRLVRS